MKYISINLFLLRFKIVQIYRGVREEIQITVYVYQYCDINMQF